MSPHIIGIAATTTIHAWVVAAIIWAAYANNANAGRQKPPLVIEAQLAYRSEKTKNRQPQKRSARKKGRKPPGVAHDPHAKRPKKPKKPPPENYEKEVEKYLKSRRVNEDVEPAPEATPEPGAWDGSEKGFATSSKGPKFLQELAADAHNLWRVPSLERGAGVPIGCVRLAADGGISDTKLWTASGNVNIDRSVRVALKALKKQRTRKKKAIPKSLIATWTTRWTCFRFRKEID